MFIIKSSDNAGLIQERPEPSVIVMYDDMVILGLRIPKYGDPVIRENFEVVYMDPNIIASSLPLSKIR